MTSTLRIGIAGLGTVGGGVAKLLAENAAWIEQRCGRPIQIVAASAKAESEMKSLPLAKARWVADATALANDKEIDVVVELVGGSEGIARKLVENALQNGTSVVTANKALLAHHGMHLAALAEKSGATLAFEAAVAGGIPIIGALRNTLAGNRFARIMGILNGTCNYILTEMWKRKASFAEVLKEAQQLGYAEANPSFDVDGIDSAHKTAILASLAFGVAPDLKQVQVSGISSITLEDMEKAEKQGCRIKLLGIAAEKKGSITQRVQPCLVPASSPLYHVDSVFNGVVVEGDAVGTVFFQGRGAGAAPTASSVVGDLMDIARGTRYKPFLLPVARLKTFSPPEAPTKAQTTLMRIEDL
jgi:homoserine dehydrogenase